MGLREFAEGELRSLIDSGDEMDREMAKDVLELLDVFIRQGHSGFSAPICASVFNRLARFKPLGPLTGEDSEWVEVYTDQEYGRTWQNRRRSSVFKDERGRAYDIDAVVFEGPDGVRFTRGGDHTPITFPYVVPDQPRIVKVDAEGNPLH